MENQNQNPMSANDQAQALTAYLEAKRQKRNRWLLGVFAAAILAFLGYFGWKNADLFRAAITETGVPAGANVLYFPDYSASVEDEGLIELKARADAGEIHSVQFTLHYTPATALVFNENSLVFDADTVFPSADLQNVNTGVPGQVTISFFSADEVDVVMDDTLVKLQVAIDPSIPAGTVIDLNVTDVEVVIPDPTDIYATSTDLVAMDAGDITVETQNDLRLLYAESLDNTHVLLHFSDLLTNVGIPVNYVIDPALAVTNVERGDAQGHEQDTVLLTTAPQGAGFRYRVTLGGDMILSNAQGGIDPDYNRALFFGPGLPGTALSDFRMVSAQATGAHTVQVTFSHPVAAASVTEVDFRVQDTATGADLNVTNATVNGSTATLTVGGTLLRRLAYTALVPTPVAADAPVRASDGAHLGIAQAVFTGQSNGPRVTGATFSDPTTLQITFDVPVTVGPDGVAGTLYPTGGIVDPFDVDVDSDDVDLMGNVLTVRNFASDSDTNYTFVGFTTADLSQGITANGFSLDSAHNSVTFWGDGHDDTQNTIGAASIVRRNVIEIQPGAANLLNFVALGPDNVELFFYPAPGVITPVDSTFVVDAGLLRITTVGPVDLELVNHYMVRLIDPTDDVTTLRTAELVVAQDFAITGATATGVQEVTVTFSENINQDTITDAATNFIFIGGLVGTNFTVNTDFRSVRVTVAGPLAPGTVYRVRGVGIRSFAGGKPLVLDSAVFAGYQTMAEVGTVRVDEVRSLSTTQMQVTFSGDVNPATVTPVNLQVLFGATLADPLMMTAVTPVNNRTFTLTTAAQTADRNYFFVPLAPGNTGIRDPQGRFLNTQRVLNAFGFTLPASTVTGFIPNIVTNDVEQTIVASGSNLNTIASVRVGTTQVTITEQPANGLTLSFVLPADFAVGVYNVVMTNQAGVARTYTNVLLVNAPAQPFRIISESSLATPFRVPNDGTTKTTLRVLVEDPVNLNNVSSVSINLTLIGGAPSVEMVKETGLQPQNRQWYVLRDVTIPNTVATSATPTLLPVQARKGSDVVNGTAQVHVTRDIQSSVAPTISQAFFAPPSVAPDGTTDVKLSAQVTDPDGADTITSVVANLGPVGVGFVPLTAVAAAGSAVEAVSRYYESAAFKIPATTPVGTYQITITAQDATGETGTLTLPLNVSTTLSGPTIDQTQSYIAPRNSVPNDGVTAFSLNVFVRDPDGLGDITSVMANFGNIGLSPRALQRSADVPDTAKSGFYTVEGVTIPTTTSMGVRQIVVMATDAAGSTANLTLQIDVTEEDTLGEPPRILVDRAYTTPRVAVNDGATPVTLHVFVRDNDNDIDAVFVNLANVGQVGPERPATFATPSSSSSSSNSSSSSGEASGNCPTGSNTLVCMQPSVREGNEGQWFVLPDITIRSNVLPSSQPYLVEVIATDQTGKTTHQPVPVTVGSEAGLAESNAPASIVATVPTSATSIEVLFSKEMDISSIGASGNDFSIVSSANIQDTLSVSGATVNAAGTIVTLTTAPQVAGREYAFSATDLRGASGIALIGGAGSRATFSGFVASDKPPVVEYVAASNPTTIEMEFRDSLRPSSVRASNIEVKASGDASGELKVLGVRFTEGATVLEVKTETQTPNQRYRVTLRDFATASGVTSPAPINKLIKGFKGSEVAAGGLRSTADLNSDGKVDFIDFTMFSAVYGTAVTAPATSAPAQPPAPLSGAPTGQPLIPQPNATVPVTTSPNE